MAVSKGKDLWSDEVAPSLHRINFGWRADIANPKGNPEQERARADGMFVYGGFGGYIEIKSARGMSWDIRGWRDDQREWYANYCQPFHTPLFIWLNIEGNKQINSKLDLKSGKYPRKAWLVPAPAMLEVHHIMKDRYGQDTLPYHARSGINTLMQSEEFDAIRILSDYELTWLGNKTWDIKPWQLLAYCANKTRQVISRDIQE
jgi:hypothetical protein